MHLTYFDMKEDEDFTVVETLSEKGRISPILNKHGKSGQFQIIANTLEGLQMLWFHGKTFNVGPSREPAETEREKLNLR